MNAGDVSRKQHLFPYSFTDEDTEPLKGKCKVEQKYSCSKCLLQISPLSIVNVPLFCFEPLIPHFQQNSPLFLTQVLFKIASVPPEIQK